MKINTPSKLEKILAAGHLAVTSECGPPRGSDPEVIVEKANLIKDHVDAINITDNQTSVTRMCSLAACIKLKLMGLEPVLQMVTRDRNRIALQSDILGAAAFDIHNVLCLSGDHQSFGDCPTGQNVHDIDGTKASSWEETIFPGRPKCLSALRQIHLQTRLKSVFLAWQKKLPPGWSLFKPNVYMISTSSSSG